MFLKKLAINLEQKAMQMCERILFTLTLSKGDIITY